MKAWIILFIILIFNGLLFNSCNNDFLDSNQQQVSMLGGKAVISSWDPEPAIELNIGIAGSEAYYITMYPKWMKWESLRGKFRDGNTSMKFSVEEQETVGNSGLLTGTVVLDIDRIGLVGFEVVYGNIGNLPGNEDGKVKEIQGKVIDADIHKPSGTIVIATQYPNQLLIFPASGQISVIPLGKSPQCVEISTDGKSVLVGNTTPEISLVSLETKNVVKNFLLDCVPYDLVSGNNGWCYIAPQGSSWTNLRSLNLNTGGLFSAVNYWNSQLFGSSILKKVPGKSLFVGTRTQVSPTGLLLFENSRGKASDTLCYWHIDLTDLWVFNDGNRIVDKKGVIYPLPAFDPVNSFQIQLTEVGRLNLPQNAINSVDFCEAKSSMFVANGANWQPDLNQGQNNVILQFNVSNLSLLNTYNPSYMAISQGNDLVLAYCQVRYVFTDQAGTRLYAIRRTAPDFGVENWSIETFEIR